MDFCGWKHCLSGRRKRLCGIYQAYVLLQAGWWNGWGLLMMHTHCKDCHSWCSVFKLGYLNWPFVWGPRFMYLGSPESDLSLYNTLPITTRFSDQFCGCIVLWIWTSWMSLDACLPRVLWLTLDSRMPQNISQATIMVNVAFLTTLDKLK